MIDEFKKYVSNYDLNNKDIKLKYNHSFRVMDLAIKYAQLIGFNEEDIVLSKEIGLLHDIGRFEQLKVYNTYNDDISIDHADYSIEQLFDKEKIKLFDKNRKNWEIIRLAIKNHNKFEIKDVYDDRTLIHCHLIRDIDKMDILYNWSLLGDIKLEEDGLEISKNVMDNIRLKKTVLNSDKRNKSDRNAAFMALIFDVHYNECLKPIYEYIMLQYNKMKYKEPYYEVIKIIREYIKDRGVIIC